MKSSLLKAAGFRVLPIVACLIMAASNLLAQNPARGPVDREERITRLRSHAVVPSREFATIQAAINAVADGGSISIKPGVYREQLTIAGKRIRLTGAGSDGGNRTQIAAAVSTAVDDHTRAVGIVNYVDGGGGVIEGISLRGGLNGIVGRDTGAIRDEVAPALANALTVRDVVISDTGRAILWHAPANLTIQGVKARTLRHNGFVFAPLDAGVRDGGKLKIVDADLSGLDGYGVLVLNTASIGCQNQISNVNVALAALGGIGVIRSGVCIFGGTLTLNHVAGIYLQQSAAIIDGTTVQSSVALPGGSWGDGIISMLSEVTVSNVFANLNDRAGLSNFGGSATLTWNTFNCNAFDLQGDDLPAGFFSPAEPSADASWHFQDPIAGSNSCGCGAAKTQCVADSTGLQAPAPIVNP
jgi:hypothetical protein